MPQSEKDIRKMLTTYEAFTILPSGEEKSDKKKETGLKKKSESDKKTVKKERWAEVIINAESFSQDAMAKSIKKLEDKEAVTSKMKKLFPNQHSQITHLLDGKVGTERDFMFEWTLAQLDQDFTPVNPRTGKKQTKSITLYLMRAPKKDTDCREILRSREARKQQDAQQAAFNRDFQQRQLQQQQQQQRMQQEEQQRMMQQQHQQQMNPQMRGPGGPMGPGGPPNGMRPVQNGPPGGMRPIPAGVQVMGGGGVRKLPVRGRPKSRGSSSSSGSSSGSGSDSDDVYDSDTPPESVSTGFSSDRRRNKKYNRRSRSRSRHAKRREEDFMMVHGSGRRSRTPHAPDFPRGRGAGRINTYGRQPAAIQGPYQPQGFFDVNQAPYDSQPHRSPVLHQAHPSGSSDVSSAIMNATINAAVQAGVAAATNARPLSATAGALTIQRQSPEPLISRPPVGARVLDRFDRIEAAEERMREDEIIRREVDLRLRQRQLELEDRERERRPLPRRRDSGFYEREREYDDAPRRARQFSPTRSDNSSEGYYPRSREGHPPRPRFDDFDRRGRVDEFDRRRMDDDRDRDYDFISRNEVRSEVYPTHPFAPKRVGGDRPSFGRAGTARW